jgi:hypothetical protein
MAVGTGEMVGERGEGEGWREKERKKGNEGRNGQSKERKGNPA